MELNKSAINKTTKVYPTGSQFYSLIKRMLTKEKINELPQITSLKMNHDVGLYMALVSLASYYLGQNANVKSKTNQKLLTEFLTCEPMQSLHNNSYGMYYENMSRAYCYEWLKVFPDIKAINKLKEEVKQYDKSQSQI